MFVHSGFADFRVFMEMIIIIQNVTVDWRQTNKQILQTSPKNY